MRLPLAKAIVHCVDCRKPVYVTETGGHYCTHCEFAPSKKDTYVQYRCPKCDLPLKKGIRFLRPYRCPTCGGKFRIRR